MAYRRSAALAVVLLGCAAGSDPQPANSSSAGPGRTGGGAIDPCEGVDVANDPENCGVCGRSCVGGTCSAGECSPVVVGTVPGALLTGAVAAGDIAYLSDADSGQAGVFSVALPQGSPTLFSPL